jgi:hypothetical protein
MHITEDMWRAVLSMAMSWQQAPIVRDFRSALPRNSRSRSQGLPGFLQGLEAAGCRVSSRPLELEEQLSLFLGSFPELANRNKELSEFAGWYESAALMQRAHRAAITWFRSRLPGFPFNPPPIQLTPGSPLMTPEYSRDMRWERPTSERPGPAVVGAAELAAMGLTPSEGRAFRNAANRLFQLMDAGQEFRRLRGVKADLTSADKVHLRAVRAQVKAELASNVVDAHEPDLIMRRDEYRRHVVSSGLSSMSGQARDYCDAFGRAEALVQFVMRDVFSQLVAYDLAYIHLATEVETHVSAGRQRVGCTVGAGLWPDIGSLAWLPVETGMSDAIQIDHVTINFDVATGEQIRVEGWRLPGTHAAWTRRP